jgi:hypothetical protein
MFLHIIEGLQTASLVALCVASVVCLASRLIRAIRGFAAIILYACMILWVPSLCLWCGTNIYLGWGMFLVIVGILLGGVGVVPIALLCFLFTGQWGQVLNLLFQCAVIAAGYFTFGWFMKPSVKTLPGSA